MPVARVIGVPQSWGDLHQGIVFPSAEAAPFDFLWTAASSTLIGPCEDERRSPMRAGNFMPCLVGSYATLAGNFPSNFSADFTIVADIEFGGAGAQSYYLGHDAGYCFGVIPAFATLFVNVNGTSGTTIFITPTVLSAARKRTVCRKIGSNYSLWMNGELVATATNAASITAPTSAPAAVGSPSGSSPVTMNPTEGVSLIASAPIGLSDEHCARLSRDPWVLVQAMGSSRPMVASVTAYYAGTTTPAAGWTSSLGGNLDAAINETTFDDANYIVSPDNNTPSPNMPLAPGNLLPGNWDVKFRSLREAITGQVRMVLLDSGGTPLFTGPWHAQTQSYQQFTDNVTLTGTATHIRIEDQP